MLKAKILIVDDIAVNRATIQLSLKREQYTFLEATNGLEAIKIAKQTKPDLILMDALMPIMDGFEATKKIREIEEIQRTPILMITSLDSKEDKINALECGVNDFVNKSFDKSELKARCKSYVEFAKLNKNYILASKNIISGLANKVELLKDIEKTKEQKSLFLLDMDNYSENENFYGFDILNNLERIFLDYLQQHCISSNRDYKLYHISTGRYAILFNKIFDVEKKSANKFCINLISSIKKHSFKYKNYEFDVNITMGYMYGNQTLYKDTNTMLSLAQKEKIEFMAETKMINKLRDDIKANLNTLHDVKQALKEDKIVPFFQPIYNNITNSINRYEALIRMYDKDGNIVAPYPAFLSVAKKSQLYPHITKVLIEKVIKKIRDEDCEISINLSSLDIENKVMQSFILDTLHKNRDITHKLIIELLEDKETNSYENINEFIKVIRRYGIKIAIDDFGSGYSNFIRIIEFKPDIIKIDGSLISNIITSKASLQTVETIKILADKIGAKIVAEYVENEEIFNIIKDMGIDYSQGYYIGKAELKIRKDAEFLSLEVA